MGAILFRQNIWNRRLSLVFQNRIVVGFDQDVLFLKGKTPSNFIDKEILFLGRNIPIIFWYWQLYAAGLNKEWLLNARDTSHLFKLAFEAVWIINQKGLFFFCNCSWLMRVLQDSLLMRMSVPFKQGVVTFEGFSVLSFDEDSNEAYAQNQSHQGHYWVHNGNVHLDW